MVITTFLRITRLMVNQLTFLCYGASARDLFFITSATFMWRLCLIIRDIINTCDDTIYNLSTYVCDWSLDAHKIMYPILSLKSGVTAEEPRWWNFSFVFRHQYHITVDRPAANVKASMAHSCLSTAGFKIL